MVALITFQFAILLLLSRIHFGHGYMGNPYCLAELKPVDPIVEAGDMLVLNCTLMPRYNGTYNASDIYFRYYNSVNYSYPNVQTLSNVTAQLRLPNITIDMRGRYRCYLPGIYLGACTLQNLHVFRRPLKPVLDSCIISNWEQMECSWRPSRADQVQHTNGHSFVQTFFYQHPGDGDNWKTCPQNASEKCTWPASQFKMGVTYCIQINATNSLKHIVASNVTCILAQEEIVKPNPVENVESSFASDYEGHVMLHWNPPTSKYNNYETPLIYHLDIQNQWQYQISNFTTTATSVKLSVVPASNYTVQINVLPLRLGFASDPVVKTFETPSTVPCKNPHTQTNAFFLVKEGRKVLLYWKPITARDSCGRGLSYEVRARQSDGATDSADIWSVVRSVAPTDNSAEVTLRTEEDEVTILSKNSVGVATRVPHVVIRIPSSSFVANATLNHRLVVEGNNNSVIVHWFATAPVENVTGYTLFWCQQQSFPPICKTPIQWQNLNGAEFEYRGYNLTLSENYLHFQVGLAVNFRSGLTTGIMWADKLYSQTAKAEAPHIVDEVGPYLGSHGAIDIRWTSAPYTVHSAYVHTFVIFYCLADHQNSCQGENQSVSIASWKSSTYSLANLEHGSKYRIWMTSVARTGSSKPSDPIYRTTPKSWVTPGAIAGIVVAIIFASAIAIGGLYVILRHLNKYRKNFVNGLNIPVALPPTQRVQIPTEAQMLGTKYEYNRQESVISGDSGRYSLSPASPATSPLLSKLTDADENVDSFMPENFSTLDDMKAEDDGYRGCVVSNTLVFSDVPKGEPVVPSGGPNQ